MTVHVITEKINILEYVFGRVIKKSTLCTLSSMSIVMNDPLHTCTNEQDFHVQSTCRTSIAMLRTQKLLRMNGHKDQGWSSNTSCSG